MLARKNAADLFAIACWLVAGLLALRSSYSVSVSHVGSTAAPNDGWFAVDLRDALWQPVRDLFGGHNPYDAPAYVARHPNTAEFDLYMPAWLLIAAPIAALPWDAAVVVWLIIGLAIAVWLAMAICRIAHLPRLPWVLPLVLAALLHSYPEYVAQSGGNPSLLVAPAAAVVLWRRQADWINVGLMSVTLIKPQFGIPIAFVLVAAGAWRTVVRAVILTLAVSAAPLILAIHNAGGLSDFIGSIGRNLDYASTSPAGGVIGSALRRVDLAAVLGHATNSYPSGVATLVGAAFFTGAACWAYRHFASGPSPTRVRSYAIACLAIMLALPHGRYDLVFLAPAMIALLGLACTAAASSLDRLAASVAIVGLGLPTMAPGRFLSLIDMVTSTARVAVISGTMLMLLVLLVGSRHQSKWTGQPS